MSMSPQVGSKRSVMLVPPQYGGRAVLLLAFEAAPETCATEVAFGWGGITVPAPFVVPKQDSNTQLRQKVHQACQAYEVNPSK